MFAPLAGLEPATYALEVRQDQSGRCSLGTSPQVGSGPLSEPFDPGRGCHSDRIANGIGSGGCWPAASLRVVANYERLNAMKRGPAWWQSPRLPPSSSPQEADGNVARRIGSVTPPAGCTPA